MFLGQKSQRNGHRVTLNRHLGPGTSKIGAIDQDLRQKNPVFQTRVTSDSKKTVKNGLKTYASAASAVKTVIFDSF